MKVISLTEINEQCFQYEVIIGGWIDLSFHKFETLEFANIFINNVVDAFDLIDEQYIIKFYKKEII